MCTTPINKYKEAKRDVSFAQDEEVGSRTRRARRVVDCPYNEMEETTFRVTSLNSTGVLATYFLRRNLLCVDHNKLWKILQEMGLPDHLICLLRDLYSGQEATVRTGHGTTD